MATLDWKRLGCDLDVSGYAVIPKLLSPSDCDAITALYSDDRRFRSRIIMEQHNFGRGEYKYFRYPLPGLVESLRKCLYLHLAPIANRWWEQMRNPTRFPSTHEEFIALCHVAGQQRPTPLSVQYTAADYNCLHQDLYGEHIFPLEVAVLLAEPNRDFTGGEFVLVEQRPRMQSRAEIVPLTHGDALIFAVRHRPVAGAHGTYRVNMRHGVSRMRTGHRHTLGIIFHDAA